MPAPNEQTPLIHTVIIAPARPRYTHSYIHRFCTIALATILVVVVILFLVPARWLPGDNSESEWGLSHSGYLPWSTHYPSGGWPNSKGLSYEALKKVLLETPQEGKVREWSEYYTAGSHLAGKNLSQAIWTRERWEGWGIKSSMVDYDIYINYPVSHRLALLEEVGKSKAGPAETGGVEAREEGRYKIKYECSMEEDVLDEDPTSGLDNRIPTFHGYSASGNVTSQ